MHALHKLRGQWPVVLKILARWAFALRFLVPDDLVALLEFDRLNGGVQAGERINTIWLTAMFLAQSLKWPPAVRHFLALLLKDRPASAKDILRCYIGAIRFSHGRSWPTIFSHMNFGNMVATTGLAVQGQTMGLLTRASPPATRLRSKSNDGFGSCAGLTAHDQEVIQLGPQKTEYILSANTTCAEEIIQNIWMEAEAAALCWPVDTASYKAFADQLVGFARRCRTFKTEAGRGLRGGQSPTHSYHSKSFCRAVLMIIEQFCPKLSDAVTLGEISQWTPDENGHLDSISSMRGNDARVTFGTPPLLIGCWACLINSSHGKAFKVDTAWLMGMVHDYEASLSTCGDEDPPFPPGTRILFQMCMDKQAES